GTAPGEAFLRFPASGRVRQEPQGTTVDEADGLSGGDQDVLRMDHGKLALLIQAKQMERHPVENPQRLVEGKGPVPFKAVRKQSSFQPVKDLVQDTSLDKRLLEGKKDIFVTIPFELIRIDTGQAADGVNEAGAGKIAPLFLRIIEHSLHKGECLHHPVLPSDFFAGFLDDHLLIHPAKSPGHRLPMLFISTVIFFASETSFVSSHSTTKGILRHPP